MIFRRRWAALLLAAGSLLPGAARAQAPPGAAADSARAIPAAVGAADRPACPDGRISQLFIDNHSVFDPQELAEEHRFQWAYRMVNALHVRTRPRFIRRELLFGPTSCYDPLLLEESERLLRAYPFIAQADVFGLLQPDGTWHVVVDTQDEWTTKLTLGVRWDNSLRFERFDLTEENFLGRGILVGGFVRDREEERELGVRMELPRIGGTRMDTRLSAGRTRYGDFFDQGFQYPFVGEIGRVAGRQSFGRRATAFAYSMGTKREGVPGTPTHVVLPVDEERIELSMAGRVGRPGNLTIFGVGVSSETLEFPGFPDAVDVALDDDFDELRAGDSAAVAGVRHQTLHSAGTRVNLLIGQRNVRFRQFNGLDALRGTQDLALGSDLALTIGRSVSALSGRDDDPDDLYVRFRAGGGVAPGPFLLLLAGGIEGRQPLSGGATDNRWQDVLSDVTFMLYWQPRDWPRHTFFGRVTGAGGWRVTHPFQLTLGGASAVRGYDQDDFPAGRRVVFSAEDRVYVGWPWPDLFDLGITLFADMGAGWAGDVPFGTDTGWRGTLGAGLRVGFPAGTRGVARVDLAWPVEGEGLGSPILRVEFSDPIGLVAGLADRQLGRSRRLPIGPDLFTVQQP